MMINNINLKVSELFSFSLVIFLFSGLFKQFLVMLYLPVIDFTLLSLSLMIVTWFFLPKRFDRKLLIICSVLLFLSFMIVSGYYTSSRKFYESKLIGVSLSFLVFLLPFTLERFNKKTFELTLIYSSLLSAILLLIYLPKFYIDGDILNQDARSIYLTVPYYLGITVILFISKIHQENKINRYYFILTLFFLYVMFFSGGRGPLVFLFLSLTMFLGKNFLNPKILVATSIVVTFVTVFSLFQTQFIPQSSEEFSTLGRALSRFSQLFDTEYSENPRYLVQMFAIDKIFSGFDVLFFGHGIGSFGYEYTFEDIDIYPHNIILEIVFEMGLIGLGAFLFFIVILLKHIYIRCNKYALVLFLYLMLNAMKSYSLVGNRMMFLIFGVLVFIFSVKREEINNNMFRSESEEGK